MCIHVPGNPVYEPHYIISRTLHLSSVLCYFFVSEMVSCERSYEIA